MPFAIAAAGVAAAGAIGGAIISSNASSKAAKAQQAGADTATAEQSREFDTDQANLKPWLTTGTGALGQLSSLYGINSGTGTGTAPSGTGSGSATATGGGVNPNSTFYQSPDYQFTLDQGIKGVDAGASATGSLDSGATRKAEIGYAGNLAAGQYDTYANRLAALAGVGQTAANTEGQLGSQYATNVGNIATNNANNQASSYIAQGNSTGAAATSLVNIGSGLISNIPTYASNTIGSAIAAGG